MSEQPSPTSPTDTSEKVEFGGINLVIGFVIGTALQFGWWALLDRLQLRNILSDNTNFLTQVLAVIGQANWPGFLLGATTGAATSPTTTPVRRVVSRAIMWACGFALAFYAVQIGRLLLQTILGKSVGDVVYFAIAFGLGGAFTALLMEWRRTPPPDAKTTVVSFRQIVKWTLGQERSAARRMLIFALLGALLGVTLALSLQGFTTWLLIIVPLVAIVIVAVRLWPPSQKTVRQWANGALVAIVIFGLLVLLALNAVLGVLAGIVVLVGYAIFQSRK
jgi:hypothetical protein